LIKKIVVVMNGFKLLICSAAALSVAFIFTYVDFHLPIVVL
jgi:hypothetical protein